MITFPLRNAALDLKGKSSEELPHGVLTIPPEVRELVEMERAKLRPEVFAANEEALLNDRTVSWYFQSLSQEVMYRRTPEGPEVLAVGADETIALRKTVSPDGRRDVKTYLGY